jgi:hypothetical protein
MMYPSSPEIDSTTLRFKGGTTWELAQDEKGIEVTFPGGKTVTYQVTQKEPERICAFYGRDT